MTTLEDIKKARKALEQKVWKVWKVEQKEVKATKQISKGVEEFSEKRGNSYARDVEHNLNAWCSIWEDNNKAKAYRKQWNEIYASLAESKSTWNS